MPLRSIVVIATLAFAFAFCGADDARAQCGSPARITVSPADDARLPRNARVRVTLPIGWQKERIECLVIASGARRTDCDGAFHLSLRAAPRAAAPDLEIPLRERDHDRGSLSEAELTPLAPLEANARYEVWLGAGDAHAPSRVIGTFVTGASIDDSPPSWNGAPHVAFDQDAATGTPMECGGRALQLTLAPAHDDQSPASSIRYALWIGDPDAALDYARAPDAVTRPYQDADPRTGGVARIQLGGDGFDDFDFSAFHGAHTVGVRALDAAGNASAPSESRVDFGGASAGSACGDSADCARPSICCEVRTPSAKRTPFGPGWTSAPVCTENPLRDCHGVERCAGATCRRDRPSARVEDCLAQSDCPRGAQCVLATFTTIHSECLYNPALDHADTAPVCSSNAECDALYPRWRALAGDDARARRWPGRCVLVRSDPKRRSACVMPWSTKP